MKAINHHPHALWHCLGFPTEFESSSKYAYPPRVGGNWFCHKPPIWVDGWLVVWNMAGLWLSIQLGMSSSSSQLTFFQRGWNHPCTANLAWVLVSRSLTSDNAKENITMFAVFAAETRQAYEYNHIIPFVLFDFCNCGINDHSMVTSLCIVSEEPISHS